ncbi:hypothetical protein J3B02_000061 [Coemansia erecta]|uniref:methylated diphthine methylhydrolase n=1 Tax=Coemansia asiatica TaxID=1052880 RepID=A0A9W8CHP0_9FUNG|nr:hypothetical protein LPJ64_004652 [Coemansia asiatica]KAJ2858680.1 hypothetical protein J3B02_000061 [Coemansia erecta]
MESPKSLASFDPVLCADSLEFYPFDSYRQRFLVGTYQLLDDKTETSDGTAKRSSERIGRIYVCDAVYASEDQSTRIIERQRIDTEAIFDIKWSYKRVLEKELVGIATADGNVSVFSTNSQSSSDSGFLTPVCATKGPTSDGSMCCSIDWSNRLDSTDTPSIAASYSDGSVRLLRFAESRLEVLDQWQAHDAEAWITSFDYWNPSVVFSGGDDSRLKAWDTRAKIDSSAPIFNLRRHQAGVCSVHSNFHRQHMLATGGYDDTVMVWDTRIMRRPLAETNVGGGVWRLKWHPTKPTQLLVGAMYNGFHVLDVSVDRLSQSECLPLPENAAVSIDMCASFMEHKSIAYGADWCQTQPEPSENKGWLVGTCSFYDHSVHLWRFSEK